MADSALLFLLLSQTKNKVIRQENCFIVLLSSAKNTNGFTSFRSKIRLDINVTSKTLEP